MSARHYSPGDIRNCMVALSTDEHLLGKLFQYRFPAGRGLAGHSFGNLFRHSANERNRRFSRSRAGALPGYLRFAGGFSFYRAERHPRSRTRRRFHGGSRRDEYFALEETRFTCVRLVPRRVRPLPEVLQALCALPISSWSVPARSTRASFQICWWRASRRRLRIRAQSASTSQI